MIIGIPKELDQNETRTAINPGTVKSYTKFGFSVIVESGAGASSHISDDILKESGAEIVTNASEIYQKSDIILKVNPPKKNELGGVLIKEGVYL